MKTYVEGMIDGLVRAEELFEQVCSVRCSSVHYGNVLRRLIQELRLRDLDLTLQQLCAKFGIEEESRSARNEALRQESQWEVDHER